MPDVSKADIIEEIEAHTESQQRKLDAAVNYVKRDEALGCMYDDPDEAVKGLNALIKGEVDAEHIENFNVREAYKQAAIDKHIGDPEVINAGLHNAETRVATAEFIIDGLQQHIDEELQPESEAERAVMLTKAIVGVHPEMLGDKKRSDNPDMQFSDSSDKRVIAKNARDALSKSENLDLEAEIEDIAARHFAVKELDDKKSELEAREGDTIPQDYAATVSEELGFDMGLDDYPPSNDTPSL